MIDNFLPIPDAESLPSYPLVLKLIVCEFGPLPGCLHPTSCSKRKDSRAILSTNGCPMQGRRQEAYSSVADSAMHHSPGITRSMCYGAFDLTTWGILKFYCLSCPYLSQFMNRTHMSSCSDLLEESVNELLVINVRKSLTASMERAVLCKAHHVIDLLVENMNVKM